jgi:hypothetical protein
LEKAPEGLLMLFSGGNTGKLWVWPLLLLSSFSCCNSGIRTSTDIMSKFLLVLSRLRRTNTARNCSEGIHIVIFGYLTSLIKPWQTLEFESFGLMSILVIWKRQLQATIGIPLFRTSFIQNGDPTRH